MKNVLDFTIHSANYLEHGNFIQRFASAYTFLEMANNPAEIFYDPDVGGHCFGCGSGGSKHSCKKDKAANKRCAFFFLFNTMCGNSALRRRFDGTPTEMQKLTGEYDGNCGSDFTVDFLFGYTGYDYRKVTGGFKAEIVAAINAGKPVISKTKAGAFQLITGYDGDALIIPEFVSYPHAKETWEEAPSYDELDVLYIIGGKGARRYTLKDGLENIRRVMEYNINEGLWDEYLTKLGEFTKVDKDERKKRVEHVSKTNMYMYNFCSFGGAFCIDSKLPDHYLHKELFSPALSALWSGIGDAHWAIVDAGHMTGKLKRELRKKRLLFALMPSKLSALSTEICAEIEKAKQADIAMLGIIKQAFAILEEATQ